MNNYWGEPDEEPLPDSDGRRSIEKTCGSHYTERTYNWRLAMENAHYEEIQLSRELVKAIAQENLPMSETTQKAYMKLLEHYAKEIEEGVQ